MVEDMTPPGYCYEGLNRTHKSGGGIGLIHRDNTQLVSKETHKFTSFEYMLLQSNTTSIILVYRPAQRKIDFSHDFDELLGHMSCMSHHILRAGDFNIHIDNSSMDSATKFIQILDQYNLQQHVNGATHTKGHTLDLVITKRDDSIIDNVQIGNCDISDHYSVFFPRYAPLKAALGKIEQS